MKESPKKPEIVVFAGPNGSGKSTITELLRPNMDYINADEIKAAIGCSDLEAAQIAEKQREEHLAKKKDFCFETVLSTGRNLRLLQRAKNTGYFIRCYYVVTIDPAINIQRIKTRVAAGGHSVPDDKVEKRYDLSLELIKDVIPICDICHIYDNSDALFRIFKKRKDEYFYDDNIDWHYEDIVALSGVCNIEKRDLNM